MMMYHRFNIFKLCIVRPYLGYIFLLECPLSGGIILIYYLQLLFLQSRGNDKDTATLMASGAEGWVRAWSIHHKGGLLGAVQRRS